MMSHFGYGIEPGPTRAVAKGWLAVVCAALVLLSAPPWALAVIDLSDTPMFTRVQPPPANIMFLLDDSGSMSFEILVQGAYDGRYPNPGSDGFCFVFDDLGDNVYSSKNDPSRYAYAGAARWKTQWHRRHFFNYLHPGRVTAAPLSGCQPGQTEVIHFCSPNLDLQGTSFTVGTEQ
jgi:hypothetical protein